MSDNPIGLTSITLKLLYFIYIYKLRTVIALQYNKKTDRTD